MVFVSLEHLDEWFEACTIEKCGLRTADALAEYAKSCFSTFLHKVGDPLENPDRRDNAPDNRGECSVCWQLLEMRMNTGVHRKGKHYKNWLFDYSEHIRDASERVASLRKGLKLLMQITVRDYCAGLIWQHAKEQQNGVYSLDELREDGSSVSEGFMARATLLMGKTGRNQVVSECDRGDAEKLADAILLEMSDRQQVVMLVKYCEANHPQGRKVPLDHPAVLQAAQCGKSQLYAARNGLGAFLIEKMMILFNEDAQAAREWLGHITGILTQKIFLKIKSEKLKNAFLSYLEEMECEWP